MIERKKILFTEDSKANAIARPYNLNLNASQTNKPLPTGEVIKIINADEQFQKERNESTRYRLSATITPTIYYPQEYHWIGVWDADKESQEVSGTYDTSIYELNVNYLLPNILSPGGEDPTVEDFRLDKSDNWVGHVVYPYDNDYTKLYEIPSFSVNLEVLPDPEDAILSIDTGITNILYNDILLYLEEYVTIWPGFNVGNTSVENFFGVNKVIELPTLDSLVSTLRISNNNFKGYTQDGVPFLFTIPVPTQNGWKTALYVPFKHNFEEGDYIFIKPIASTEVNKTYKTCDPKLYGFYRVLDNSWPILSEDIGNNYIIIDYKTQYRWDWTTLGQGENTEGKDYNWPVTSSQGFIKRVANYSNGSTQHINTEEVNNGTFLPVTGSDEIDVTLLVKHQLKENDFTLITISQEAEGTDFPDWKKPSLFNLSGIYTVSNIVDDYTFSIRGRSQQDLVAFWNGTYTLSQVVLDPHNYYIECYKLISTPSEYYLKKGKIISTVNNFESSQLPMSNSIFMDTNYNIVIDEDINIKGLENGWGFPITKLYLMITKRAGVRPFNFTDVETFFSWKFQYNSLLVKTGEGLDIVSKRSDAMNKGGYIKSAAGGYMEEFGTSLGDWYYIDFSEFNNTTLLEKQVTTLSNRFNTTSRECGITGECNYAVLENNFDGINLNLWTAAPSHSTSNISLTGSVGRAQLTSTAGWTSTNPNASSGGNFIKGTLVIPNSLIGELLVLTVTYEQLSSTGMVRMVDPGGNPVLFENGQYGLPVGNAGTIAPPATSSNVYTISFIPSVSGTYLILLGLMNYSGTVSVGNYEGFYDDLSIIKYFGTPQYGGWAYDPVTEYTLRVWSSYIETADPQVLGIPYYARYVDGLYFWRDLLDVGYFEDVDRTKGVEYPFLNGGHYINEDKSLMVSLTPYRVNQSTNDSVIFGCMDNGATNYLTVATYACGDLVDQGGPCVVDALGVMQTDTPGSGNYNSDGCCCQYDGNTTTNVITEGNKFATRTVRKQISYNPGQGPTPAYDVGDQNIGWNICRGIYPFWKDATYWGTNFTTYDTNDTYPTVILPTQTKLSGVMTGTDSPAFNADIESGNMSYDMFRWENYSTNPNFNALYGPLGDGAGASQFSDQTGQIQGLFDLASGSYGVNTLTTSGSWIGNYNNGLSTWGSTITDTNGDDILPSYFSHQLFEFYKFDTTQCKTCYDKGIGTISTGDYLAPRHGWPVDVNSDGDSTSLDPSGNGIPDFQLQPLPGALIPRSTGLGSSYEGGAGIIAGTDLGSDTVNIAAHRIPTDPTNWRMFYGSCVSTWGCMGNEAEKAVWPSGSSYPECVDPACTTEADCIDVITGCGSTWGPLPSQTWVDDHRLTDCDSTTNCSRQCSCVNPAGGSEFTNYYQSSPSLYSSQLLPQEQPSVFSPNIPPTMVNTYEFRGRVNIEMGINYDGYEKYYNNINIDQGWAVAGPNTGGPQITFNNPYMAVGSALPDITSPNTEQNLAASLYSSNSYKKYTRLYSGFWIGIVSTKCGSGGPGTGNNHCTYIYDPDDGTEGGGTGAPLYQSDGWGATFSNVKWQHGCGGWKKDGITQAVNKMAYSPCRNNSNAYGDCVIGDTTSPQYDIINHLSSEYLPSCGEVGMTSTKSDFQKLWSQSFKSEEIPMHPGDKAFIFIRSVGGTLRTNNNTTIGYGSQNITINGTPTNVEVSLPTYWAGRLVSSS